MVYKFGYIDFSFLLRMFRGNVWVVYRFFINGNVCFWFKLFRFFKCRFLVIFLVLDVEGVFDFVDRR